MYKVVPTEGVLAVKTGWQYLRGLTMAAIMSGGLALAVPAHAQFSEGYRFLEAVKKLDGSTTAYTLTLDDAVSPTSTTRSG